VLLTNERSDITAMRAPSPNVRIGTNGSLPGGSALKSSHVSRVPITTPWKSHGTSSTVEWLTRFKSRS
jgi:hypothetical protein